MSIDANPFVPVPAMSNAERQRLFRRRHPGYHRNYYVPSDRERTRVRRAAVVAATLRAPATPAESATSSFDPAI